MKRLNPLALALLVAVLLVGTTTGAVAGSMITGAQIKDGTVTTKDIKNGTVALGDLATATRRGLQGARVSGELIANDGTPHVAVLHGPSGVTATVTNPGVGYWCITLHGTSLTTDNAVMVATPDYADDSSSPGSGIYSTVEVYRGAPTVCPGAFKVLTFRHDGADASWEDFGFTFEVS